MNKCRSPQCDLRAVSRILIAALFCFTGTQHFLHPLFFLNIMPPQLPTPLALVYLSGACELGFACALAIRRWHQFAGYGLVALLFAVFPANVYMALSAAHFPRFNEVGLFVRLPLQFILIAWILSSLD